MAQLSPEEKAAIGKALDQFREGRVFEDYLARELRRAGLTYETYIRLAGEIRSLSKKKKITMAKAAELYVSDK